MHDYTNCNRLQRTVNTQTTNHSRCPRLLFVVTLAASSGKRNVTVWRPSLRLSFRLSRWHTHRDSPGVACDAASVHFGPTVRRTDIHLLSRPMRSCFRSRVSVCPCEALGKEHTSATPHWNRHSVLSLAFSRNAPYIAGFSNFHIFQSVHCIHSRKGTPFSLRP